MAKLDLPDQCECDNTHRDNNTVCRFCWALGLRGYSEEFENNDERTVTYTIRFKWPVSLCFDNSDNPKDLDQLKYSLAANLLDLMDHMGPADIAECLAIHGADLVEGEHV